MICAFSHSGSSVPTTFDKVRAEKAAYPEEELSLHEAVFALVRQVLGDLGVLSYLKLRECQ